MASRHTFGWTLSFGTKIVMRHCSQCKSCTYASKRWSTSTLLILIQWNGGLHGSPKLLAACWQSVKPGLSNCYPSVRAVRNLASINFTISDFRCCACRPLEHSEGDVGSTILVSMPWEASIVRHFCCCSTFSGRFSVASRKKDPTPLKRVWVIWEIFCAYQTGARFDIAMSLRRNYAGASSVPQFMMRCLTVLAQYHRCQWQ